MTNCPGSNVARCLKLDKKLDTYVIGVDFNPLAGGLHDSAVDSGLIVPHPIESTNDARYGKRPTFSWTGVNPEYVQVVTRIIKETRTEVAIPTLSMEIPVYASMSNHLLELGVKNKF